MKPTLTPHQFVEQWANVHLKQSASYVTRFDDLCALVGHPKPAHMDKTGELFTYQKGAVKAQADEIVGHGFASLDSAAARCCSAWLQNAHRKLDEAVSAAYGWPGDLGDDEILARLLDLNLQRAGKG